jgi:hypothetical protein
MLYAVITIGSFIAGFIAFPFFYIFCMNIIAPQPS